MTPHDAPQATKFGDTIGLLACHFGPLTIDHMRAADALRSMPDVSQVWLAPTHCPTEMEPEHSRAMCMMASVEAKIGCCTIGLDKKLPTGEAVSKACQKLFPYFKFKLAGMHVDDGYCDVLVRFGAQPGFGEAPASTFARPEGAKLEELILKYPSAPSNLREQVAAGYDAARWFLPPIWHYIQKRKLFR